MSHFTVAVFTQEGQTIRELLEPYNENLDVERYVRYTKEELIAKSKEETKFYATQGPYAKYLKDPEKYEKDCKDSPDHLAYVKRFPERFNWTDEEHYQNQIKFYDEEEIGHNGEIYSKYNPNSKWDWYVIGGRWSGLLKLKAGGENVDSAKIKDIDFSLDIKKYNEALRFWELVVEGDTPKNDNEKEMIKHIFYNAEYYKNMYGTKEKYAKTSAQLVTYSVLTPDGIWHSEGDMGWFGCGSESGEESQKWNDSFQERFIDTADPEWTLTIVDCHI